MKTDARSWMFPVAGLALSVSLVFAGCQMQNPPKTGTTKQAAAAAAGEHFDRGFGFYNKGLWADSIAAYDQALKAESGNAKFYAARGNTYLKMGNIPFAIVDFSKAIDLDPRSAQYFYSRASAYFSINDFAKALADADKAEKLGMNVSEFKKKAMQAGRIFDAQDFVLTGILADEKGGYLAIINDEVVGIGSVVNKARVINITPYHVKLDHNGEIIIKTIPSTDVTQQPAPVTK